MRLLHNPEEYYHSCPKKMNYLRQFLISCVLLTSGGLTGACNGFADFCKALICKRALNGALQIGQLFA